MDWWGGGGLLGMVRELPGGGVYRMALHQERTRVIILSLPRLESSVCIVFISGFDRLPTQFEINYSSIIYTLISVWKEG